MLIAIAFPVETPPRLLSAVDAVVAPVPPATIGNVPAVKADEDVE
jgi:hypothetical protein